MKSPVTHLPSQEPNNHGPECVVNGGLALVLRVSSCAGAAAIKTTVAGSGWRVTVSNTLVVFQYIVMTILNLIALAALMLDFLEDPGKRRRVGETAFAAFLWIADLALAMVMASLVVYSEPERMKRLLRVLKQLQQINVKLNNDPSTKCEKTKIITVFCLSVWATVSQATEVYRHWMSSKNGEYNWSIDVMYCPYYVANLQGLLAALQWCCTALAVRAAAAALNQHLQGLRYGSEITACPSQLQATIRRLALAHEQLGNVVKQMNAANGTIVLVTLMATFLRLVVSPYYIFLHLYSGGGFVGVVVLPLLWIVLHLSMLLVTVEPCHLTQKQRETTKFLLSQLLVHLGPRSERLSEELNSFVTQIRLCDVKFMPLGVYVLTRPLLATILGGVITYLVIILQFLSYTDHIK